MQNANYILVAVVLAKNVPLIGDTTIINDLILFGIHVTKSSATRHL